MKRLVLPLLMALAVHAVLFQAELPLAKPVLLSPQSRSVSINLVAVQKHAAQTAPATPAPKPPPPPKPQPQPVKPPASKAPAVVKPYVPDLKTIAAIEPMTPLEAAPEVPEPQQTLSEEDTIAAEQAPATTTPGPASDSAEVILSVPRYDLNPPFEYPRLARRRHWEGTVILDVLIDKKGAVAELNVARSSGHTLLDRNALAQVRNWRFEPARKGGQAIAMRVAVPVRYQLK